MKKIFFLLILVTGFAFSGLAQQLKFYYYPSSNIYYDVSKKKYIYPANGTWNTVTVLPAKVRVGPAPRVVVYHSSPQVWASNADHVKKYNPPKGKAVGYKGTNANKAKGKKS